MAVLLMLLGLQLGPYLRPRSIDATVPRATTWLPFFAATGCAALLAQVALLQRYQLVLGSPTLTLVALLFPLLFFGGVSSLASTRLSDAALSRVLPWSCLALGALLVLHLAVFSVVRDLIESQSLLARVLSIMILLAPLGMLTGLPFPVALRRLSPLAETIVPWAWGGEHGGVCAGFGGRRPTRCLLRIADGRPHGSTGLWARWVVGVPLSSKGVGGGVLMILVGTLILTGYFTVLNS